MEETRELRQKLKYHSRSFPLKRLLFVGLVFDLASPEASAAELDALREEGLQALVLNAWTPRVPTSPRMQPYWLSFGHRRRGGDSQAGCPLVRWLLHHQGRTVMKMFRGSYGGDVDAGTDRAA
jgi:hypothetical protein